MRLPKEINNHYFYLTTKNGGLGVPSLEDNYYHIMVNKIRRITFLAPKIVPNLAFDSFFRTTRIRTNQESITDYLNDTDPTVEGNMDHKSFWSAIPKVLKACNLKANIDDYGGLGFFDLNGNIFEAKNVVKHIRKQRVKELRLIKMPNKR